MNVSKLLTYFPEARQAWQMGEDWEWSPSFEDGYPCPVFDSSGWSMVAYHPGFKCEDGDCIMSVYEMTKCGDTRAVHRERLLAQAEDETSQLIVGLIQHCWRATTRYLHLASVTGDDPLRLMSDTGVVSRAEASEALKSHWDGPNGSYELTLLSVGKDESPN